jgi:hypothetical protein
VSGELKELVAVVLVDADGSERIQFLEEMPLIGPPANELALRVLAQVGGTSRGQHVRVVRFRDRVVVEDFAAPAVPERPTREKVKEIIGSVNEIAAALRVPFGRLEVKEAGKGGDA